MDYNGKTHYYQVQTEITVAWEESAPFEEKLERIITQKWIANFPLGFEAWVTLM